MGLALGIDIGTTKSAAVIVDTATGEPVAVAGRDHGAATGEGRQSPERHWAAFAALMTELPADLKKRIESVGVTGQMHGVMLWSRDGAVSPLYTWQNREAGERGLLAGFQALPGCAGLRDGFGLTTLAMLAGDGGLKCYDHAATVHDWLAARLCRLEEAVTDRTDAASWGCFDLAAGDWDPAALAALGVSRALLPRVEVPGAWAGVIGREAAAEFGLPEGTPVMVPTGDNQASVAATSQAPAEELYLTLGTGAQLSAIVGPEALSWDPAPGMELRPYHGGQLLAVTAPLCGGRAWAWLMQGVKDLLTELGMTPPGDRELYDRIDAAGRRELDADDLPRLEPHFLGERYAPDLRGCVCGLTLNNFTLGKMAAALALGVIANLRSGLPEAAYRGRCRVVASGNALRRTELLRLAAKREFGLPLELTQAREEAACGAALLSAAMR